MPINEPWLLGLLVAATLAVGWLLHAWIGRRRAVRPGNSLSEDYFRGLNYLLNEQPDKALEVFIKMVEVDSDTIETHFALGSLFRRRGEVDRAIRIHQNLIARPNLSRHYRTQALYELGDDYMRAGLFDRAESLFADLAQAGPYIGPALRQLLAIYEQQRDWEQAITAAQRLEGVEGRSQQRVIAHYWCELAEVARAAGQQRRALQLAAKAQAADRKSVRADMLTGALLEAGGKFTAALRWYRRVIEHDPAFAGEVLPAIDRCHRRGDDVEGLDRFLSELRRTRPDTVPYVALAAFHEPQLRSAEIFGFISSYLETRGHGLARLLEKLVEQRSLDPQMEVDSAREVVRVLLEDHPRYRCTECGLTGNALYWQCPSCRGWSSTKPHAEVSYPPAASALPEVTGRR